MPPETTPETILDALRDHPEWDDRRRDEELDRLVAGFDADRLIGAARARLGDLGRGDGEAVLRLIEAFGGREDLEALAEALTIQADLPPERAWDILELLEGSGLIERRPALADRREEIDEAIDGEEDILGILAAQIEDEEGGAWLALHGLGAIEPSIREEILDGLASREAGPGLVEFFRLLAFAHDPRTSRAALSGLERMPGSAPGLAEAWASIAVDHPSREIAAIARKHSGPRTIGLPAEAPPTIARSLVSTLDGKGRGLVAILAEHRGRSAAAVFECDVTRGIIGVVGRVGPDLGEVGRLVDDLESEKGRKLLENAHELAIGLLGAALAVCGPSTPPSLRFWLERTIGPRIRPRPIASESDLVEERAIPAASAEAILLACPDWVDDSDLTFELADELRLRNRTLPPDPIRDAGAFRFLFENRLQGRLGLDAAMLSWMAAFWRAERSTALAKAASEYARQLADPQHAVPAHPFVAALGARSLAAAQAKLARGIDPRDGGNSRKRKGDP